MTVNPVIVRNILRYFAGALVARGVIGADTGASLATDPVLIEVATVSGGVVLGIMTEVVYGFAKRLGWRT